MKIKLWAFDKKNRWIWTLRSWENNLLDRELEYADMLFTVECLNDENEWREVWAIIENILVEFDEFE